MNTQARSPLQTSRLSLWFGVLATPLAWSAQELLSYMLASAVCAQYTEGTGGAQVHASSFVAITAGTLAIGFAGAWAAAGNWRKARRQGRHTGIANERVRFLARCGLINSVVFLVAFAFTTAQILVAPLCGS